MPFQLIQLWRMSKYMIDVSRDLTPDNIKRELELVLQIENRGENNVIVANGDYSGTFSSSSSESEETSTEVDTWAADVIHYCKGKRTCE